MEGTNVFTGVWYEDGSLEGGQFGESMLSLRCDLTVHFGA